MERLTESHIAYDPWELCGQDKYCKRGCHDEGGCTNGCPVPKLYWRLEQYERTGLSPERVQELAAAERERRLVVLPCMVFERAYRVCDKWTEHFGCCGCLDDYGCGTICEYWDKEKKECTNIKGMYGESEIISTRFDYQYIPDFGKTVFLTRPEAEAALAKMKEE